MNNKEKRLIWATVSEISVYHGGGREVYMYMYTTSMKTLNGTLLQHVLLWETIYFISQEGCPVDGLHRYMLCSICLWKCVKHIDSSLQEKSESTCDFFFLARNKINKIKIKTKFIFSVSISLPWQRCSQPLQHRVFRVHCNRETASLPNLEHQMFCCRLSFGVDTAIFCG